MIKVFSGTDTYESFIAAVSEAKKIAKKESATISYINGDELNSIEEIFAKTEGIGLFNDKSIFIVKRLFTKASVEEEFTQNFERLDKDDLIIWIPEKIDSRKKFAKLLKKEKRLNIYDEGKSWQIEKWLENYLKKFSFKLTKDQIIFLLQISENNKWLIRSELNKIDIYCKKNEKNELTKEELNKITGAESSGNIWEFLNFFSSKSTTKAKQELNKILRYSDLSQYVISMLNRELQMLLDVKCIKEENGELKLLKLHPFVLQKAVKNSENFSLDEIEKLSNSLFNLDLSIKNGEINSSIGLNLYLDGLNKKYFF